jgi:hypothetical protein
MWQMLQSCSLRSRNGVMSFRGDIRREKAAAPVHSGLVFVLWIPDLLFGKS